MFARTAKTPPREKGISLVELIVFIVIVGVAVVGILSALNVTARSSADPMIRKQMLAIAESLLAEVSMMPFTYCDPDDPLAVMAAGTAGCTLAPGPLVEVLGPDGGETRSNATVPFDNVNDYWVNGGMSLASPVMDISNTYQAPPGYSATIEIFAEALHTIASNSTPATMEALRIAVTVSRGGDSLTLEGYRTRYAPNAVP